MTPAALKLRLAHQQAERNKPPRNKYGARRTVCGQGHQHDSGREAARCAELHLLARAGQIAELELQRFYPFVIGGAEILFPNGRRAGVTVDFVYREGGKLIAEDSKGHRVRDWPLRRAVFEALYPDIEVRET